MIAVIRAIFGRWEITTRETQRCISGSTIEKGRDARNKRNPENDGVHGPPEGAVQHSNESNDIQS